MNTDPAVEQGVQKLQETAGERDAREKAGFPQIEALLKTKIGSRLNIPLVGGLSSYLGQRNPFASAANSAADLVWLLDNTAYRPVHPYPHAEQPWQAEFVAAYFERNSGKDLSKWVAEIADAMGLRKMQIADDEGKAIIAKRLEAFTREIRPAKFVNVEFPNGDGEKLGPGARNAISSQIKLVPGEYQDGAVLEVNSIPPTLAPQGPMVTYFASPEGWAVVSGMWHVGIRPLPLTHPIQTSTILSRSP
jgi:hypothetical protein